MVFTLSSLRFCNAQSIASARCAINNSPELAGKREDIFRTRPFLGKQSDPNRAARNGRARLFRDLCSADSLGEMQSRCHYYLVSYYQTPTTTTA